MKKNIHHAPRHLIGGVALTNGVLLHAPDVAVMAIRDAVGIIHTKHWEVPPAQASHSVLHLPGIRGLWLLWRTVLWNSRVRMFAHEIAQELIQMESKTSSFKKSLSVLPASMFPSLGFLAALLLYAEVILVVNGTMQILAGDMAMARSTLLAFLATFIVLYFVVKKSGIWEYMAYHGAEHQAIHAYEEGKRTFSAVEKSWPFQVRCGAAVVSYVAIFLLIVGFLWPNMSLMWSVALAILLFSLSYEVVLVLDRYSDAAIVGVLSMPGVVLQLLVARHPDTKHSEVATKALFELTHYSKALKNHSKMHPEMMLT